MAGRYLVDDEINGLLNEDSEFHRGADNDDEEEGEEEVITRSDHESESEQEYDSNSNEDNEQSSSTQLINCFIGRDKKCRWNKTCSSASGKTKSRNIVNNYPGPKSFSEGVTSEVDAFTKMISLEMIDEIVGYTNIYMQNERISAKYSRERDARETTRSEMMALMGLLYLIGVKKANHTDVTELWAVDGSGIEITRAVMGFKRFLFLLRCIHFDDKRTRQERRVSDKLAAIRTILDQFVANCKNSYNVSDFVTVDEKLQAFRGRCSFLQYLPNKPTRYGIKIFVLADAITFFTNNVEVYCGKQPPGPFEASVSPNDIVERLVSHLEGSNRNVTMDNWYSSYALAVSLKKKGLTCIGALKKNKMEIPQEFTPHRGRAVQSSMFGFQKDMTLVSYVPKRNKAVILLSTMHDDGTVDEDTGKPHILLDYNSTKGAVDTIEQMCGRYSVARVTRRWPLVIFYSLLDIAGINAQIIYCANEANQRSNRRIFLKEMSLSLLKPRLIERAKIPSLPTHIATFLQKYKEPRIEEVEEAEEPVSRKRGRCVACGRGKNVTTTIRCDICRHFMCKRHVHITHICERCQVTNEVSDEKKFTP
ncbi:piggyBac transposable element-derived protein 4-like [Periplaneta americana]|uniref:piggyBac transposable element-derived protein 4-like n=1 Tax=Periplaneta americana TaxID=6978 RepID=UPI0037E8F001